MPRPEHLKHVVPGDPHRNRDIRTSSRTTGRTFVGGALDDPYEMKSTCPVMIRVRGQFCACGVSVSAWVSSVRANVLYVFHPWSESWCRRYVNALEVPEAYSSHVVHECGTDRDLGCGAAAATIPTRRKSRDPTLLGEFCDAGGNVNCHGAQGNPVSPPNRWTEHLGEVPNCGGYRRVFCRLQGGANR